MIRVLVVDDHDLVRAGITRLLSDAGGIKVVGEAASGEEAIKLAKDKQPEVILMDVRMPGIGGLEATRKIAQKHPLIKIIALTMCQEEPFPSKFFQAGASGYLTKGAGAEEMVDAIRSAVAGRRYVSPEIARQLALKPYQEDEVSPFDTLTERELLIMMMITRGDKVTDISDKLHLSPKTINSYRYRLFEKLEVTNDVELTHLALKHGLLDTELKGTTA